MKFLLLGLFLGLALAFPDQNINRRSYSRIQEISYRPGKEYVYQYDTQVLTGLPQTSKVHAGFRLSCLARVQFNTASKVRVVFEKITLYRINEPVVQWKATERLMPEEFLKDLTGDEANTMAYYLQIPFGFDYDDGQVLKILLEDSETSWSANIKRGFTSLFEMNLEKRYLLDESFPAIKSSTPPHANWYNVFERSTTGDCATLYTVTPNTGNDHMYVTKTRDYNRCINRPVYLNSMWDGQMTQDAQKDNPLLSGATLKYNVRGNDRKFLILSTVGEGHIVFTPYKNQEQVRTSLNQTLYLKDSRWIGREVQEIPEVHHGEHKKDTLRMTLPSRPVDCQDPFLPCQEEPKQINRREDVYSADKIYLHLTMAARNTREITSEESLQHIRIVKDMLKTSPEPIIKKLWEKLYTSKVNPQADIDRLSAEILWNILPSVATEAVANVVLDICTRDLLMTKNCTAPIRNLALKATPTTELTDKLIKLTKVGRLTRELKQTAYLALGVYGYKLTRHLERHTKQCQQELRMIDVLQKNSIKDKTDFIQTEKRLIENRCNTVYSKYQQTEEKILRTLKKLSQSPRQEDEILALKSLGNSGMQGILPILKKYVDNHVETNMLRIMAINAHRRVQYPETARKQAIKTLLKLYLTTSEKSEIRQFAFYTLATLKPELPVYETVAMSLRHEKDAQLSGFVHSYFTTFSNSTYRPDSEYKRNMTAALKFAPQGQTGLEQSFVKRIGHLSDDYKRGAALALTTIGDMSRYMGAAINVDTYNYGLISQLFEIGFDTEGLSPFLNKLWGPRGLLTQNKSLFDLLKRGPRDISPQDAINQIFKTLRIKERSMPTPYGNLYYNIMGHELGYLDFTNLLRTVSATGLYPLTYDEEGLRMGLPLELNTMYDLSDYQLTLPTEAGLPVSLRIQATSSIKIDGSLTFKVTPYMLESDRQGQPPISLTTKIDINPKLVGEVQCSMGLDMFYVKPVVGYRGLIKYNAPIKNELKVDLTYRRVNLKFVNPTMEKPAIEMILEPFSEFVLITKKNESPVFVLQRNNIYTPIGTRALPLSRSYKLKALGYELAITGQLPHCLSKTNPIRPLNGRSLINIFWRPMENAPSAITLHVQDIRPLSEAVANSYAQTYQGVLTSRPEQYGRDFSRMDQSGVMKFDKYGRPMPQSPEEILPYSDSVDIQNKPVNMQQMCNKFQRIFQKPMPFYNREGARGLVVLLDASSKNTKRQVQLETVWNYFKNGHVGRMFTRMWRSSIPDYDTQDWQMLSEMGVSYPLEVMEPSDIYDPKWQSQLMKDLEYLISQETYKVDNQGINMTVLSSLEQPNYPAMINAPTYRILTSIIPEQLYRLMGMSGRTIYNRQWNSYWRDLGPVYNEIKQELRKNVDPSFVKRDLPLMDQLTQILKVQERFLSDLRDILSKTVMAHAEIPIIQWIDYVQTRSVYMIREIFNKDRLMDRLHDAEKIHNELLKAETNVDSIVSLMHKLMQRVTSVSQKLDKEGKPVVVFKPEELRKVSKQADLLYAYDQQQPENMYERQSEYQSSSYYTTENLDSNRQSQQESFYRLRMALNHLSLKQMKLIENVQLSISNMKEFDYDQWLHVLETTKQTLNIFDRELKTRPVNDPISKQSLLLVTVQNEFITELCEQWKRLVAGKPGFQATIHEMQDYSMNLMLTKERGNFLGERVSLLYHNDMIQTTVVPNLNSQEYPIYKEIAESKRMLVVENRFFEINIKYNCTNMKNPEALFSQIDKFTERITNEVEKIAGIQRELINLGKAPKLYLVSELMDAVHYLKFTTEFASRTFYTINNERRFTYLEKMSHTATKIQTLISGLSPIFNKYEQNIKSDNKNHNQNQMSILNTMPIDTRVLDVQDVLVQQKMLKEQLRRFIQNPDVTSEDLSRVLDTAVDRLEMFQETLKQNQLQVQTALQQKKVFERQAVSSLWTEALNKQRNLYESLLTIYKNNRDSLREVVRSTERINALEMEVAKLETDHQETMTSLQQQHVPEYNEEFEYSRDTYSYTPKQQVRDDEPRQQWMQRLTPYIYLPNGVTAFWNFTWGNADELNKNAKVQFMASRSVEQIMYMYRQMSAILRSEDVVEAINRRVADEPWFTESIMQKFNTFNHLQVIAESQKENLPQMFLNNLQYAQDFFKATFWNEYKRQPATRVVSKNQFQAMLDISDRNQQVDLYILNNDETDIYQGLKVGGWVKKFPIIQNYTPLKEKLMNYFTLNRQPAKCMLNKDRVYTFDKVSYQLPSKVEQNEALLAADCTDDKTFAVTMVKSNTTFKGQTIKIINEDKIIEITPDYLNTEVRVNGKVVVLDENKPVIFYKKLHYDLFEPSVRIVRKGYRVQVDFPQTGLHFLMEGTYIQLKVSELYKRKLCGLCSNFDRQMSWEFEGPRQEIYTTPRLFSQSYILREQDRHTYHPDMPEFTEQHDRSIQWTHPVN